MARTILFSLAAIALVCAVALAQAVVDVREILTGYEEVPSISTEANGQFNARIARDNRAIEWELSYSDLEGTVQQAHIHFGTAGVNGGIIVFLCTNQANGPVGTPLCPRPPAVISGRIFAADVSPNIAATQAVRAQGIASGEIEELSRAMRAGATYVNVHTSLWPNGEIRSQIRRATP